MTSTLAPNVPSPDSFGPALSNVFPVEDPTTDLDAANWNASRVQTAAMGQTNFRAHVRFTVTGGVVSLQEHAAVWSEAANPPTVVRSAEGDYTITWPEYVYDLQDAPEQHAVNLTFPQVSVGRGGSLAMFSVLSEAPTPRTVRVRVIGSPGTLIEATEVFVSVR